MPARWPCTPGVWSSVAKIDRLADLDPGRVQEALKALRDEGLSLETVNRHRTAIRAFSKWCWKSGRTRTDTLVGVTGFNVKEDRRHDRRTLGVDELRVLIEVTHTGPPWRKMSGPARALCYRLGRGDRTSLLGDRVHHSRVIRLEGEPRHRDGCRRLHEERRTRDPAPSLRPGS